MIINHLNQLKPVEQRAIIINYNTKNVTFLALLSTLRYAGVPVLLIDCESTDGSFEFFSSLMSKYKFDVLSAPLKIHGLTLDWLFSNINDDKILLIDSDLEIIDKKIILFLNEYIDMPEVFGSSFLVGPKIIKEEVFKGTNFENALLYERPFIPIALFKVEKIKEAIKSGVSFAACMIDNRFANLPPAMVKITRKIFSIIGKKTSNFFRKRYFTSYPEYVYFDTGAKIYEHLRYERFLFFSSLPRPFVEKYVNHFHGATRHVINPNDKQTGELYNDIDRIVLERLKNLYNEVAPQ